MALAEMVSGWKIRRTREGSVQPVRLPFLVPVRKLARGCWCGRAALAALVALMPDRAWEVIRGMKVAVFIRLDQQLMDQHDIRLW